MTLFATKYTNQGSKTSKNETRARKKLIKLFFADLVIGIG